MAPKMRKDARSMILTQDRNEEAPSDGCWAVTSVPKWAREKGTESKGKEGAITWT